MAAQGHKKHVKAELSAFMVPAESSPGISCAVSNHGDRDLLLGALGLPRGKRRRRDQLVPQAPQLNTESQNCVLGGSGKAGFGRGFVWV